MPLAQGSIAFTGFNSDGSDGFSVVALEELGAGEQIIFTDHAWSGSAFPNDLAATLDLRAGSFVFTVPAGGIAAGTSITFANLGALISVNIGGNDTAGLAIDIDPIVLDGDGLSFGAADNIYAVQGSVSLLGEVTPTRFLAAIGSDIGTVNTTGTGLGDITGTGIPGFVEIPGNHDVNVYAGITSGTPEEVLAAISNSANWLTGDGNGSSTDGIGAEFPSGIQATFSLTGEVIIGGSGDDDLDGTGSDDTISGGDGNDNIDGKGGDDEIDGGSGNDTINGGDGNDTINGGSGNDIIDGGAGNDNINGGTGNDVIDGGAGNDNINGGDGNDVIDGGPGNDNINGNAGDDIIIGGSENDNINGGAGDDFIVGGAGNDFIDGGDGIDTVDYTSEDGAGSIIIDLTNGTVTDSYGNTDTLRNIEIIRATSQNDALTGDNRANWFSGFNGIDQINGMGGFDTIDYSVENGGSGLNVNFTTGAASDSFGETDLLTSIEGVIGTNNDDTFTGSAVDEHFEGLGGTDIINAGGGNDMIFASLLDGDDQYNGDDGIDTLFFGSGFSAGVTVNLTGNSSTGTQSGNDTVSTIENVTGGNGNDVITGDSLQNILFGLFGNDVLNGMDGADILSGGAGNDTINGGLGFDRAEGGSGNDVLYGEGGTDSLFGGTGNDRIFGGDSFDRLYGALGNDVIYGGNGNDVMHGQAGTDRMYGESGNDILLGGIDRDFLFGGDGNDRLNGQNGNDLLRGGAGNDTIYGAVGNDLLIGGSGNDNLFGGIGVDTVRIFGSRDNFDISNISGGNATIVDQSGDQGRDILSGIERIVFDDDVVLL